MQFFKNQITQAPKHHYCAFENELVVFFGREKEDSKEKDKGEVYLRYFKGDAETDDEKLLQEVKCANFSADDTGNLFFLP